MINFTVGPVQSNEIIRKIGYEQVPYFRTPEFSCMMLENEKLIKQFVNSTEESKVVFITGSGTASMEASIINTLTSKDKAIIVNGGSFGHRFLELCTLHEIPFSEIKIDFGKTLKKEMLDKYEGDTSYTSFIVNIHETSTGVLYNLDMISNFCKRNNLFLIVDAISSFLADPIDMREKNIDLLITGSQKALACHPGISIIVLSSRAVDRVYNIKCKSMYLDLQNALENAKRGQTPYTPAVGILRQINARLKQINKCGGVKTENERIKKLAQDFRNRIKNLPLKMFAETPSNAVTSLQPINVSAYDIFIELKDKYHIWICPNGGELKDKVFRVGHIGDLTEEDNQKLIDALNDMMQRGLL